MRARPTERDAFHSVRALDSNVVAGVVVAGGGTVSSSGEHTEMTNGICVYHGLNIHKINLKISVKNSKKRFSTPNFRKPLFLAIVGLKLDKSSELIKLKRHKEACNNAK